MRQKVVLNNKYMQAELLELMKQRQWSAGVPFMAKMTGMVSLICFPAIDQYNQVQIQLADGSDFNKHIPNNVVYVSFGNECKDFLKSNLQSAIGGCFGVLGDIIRSFSPKRKKAKELVMKTVEELQNAGF